MNGWRRVREKEGWKFIEILCSLYKECFFVCVIYYVVIYFLSSLDGRYVYRTNNKPKLRWLEFLKKILISRFESTLGITKEIDIIYYLFLMLGEIVRGLFNMAVVT